MTDPHLEDHAVGLELQMTELVERLERARVQGRHEDAEGHRRELEVLQEELAVTAETIAGGRWPRPGIQA